MDILEPSFLWSGFPNIISYGAGFVNCSPRNFPHSDEKMSYFLFTKQVKHAIMQWKRTRVRNKKEEICHEKTDVTAAGAAPGFGGGL